MKLSPRITTVASSAVANLCLIPETGGEEEGADRRGVKLKPFGKWRTHAAESNQCAMTRAGARHRDGRVEVWRCACVRIALTNAEFPPKRRFMSHSVTSVFII